MKRLLVVFVLLLVSCATVPPPQPVHVVIVGTTDVHGWFAGHEESPRGGEPVRYGGVATLAAYVNALRAQNPGRVILVDSGDIFQGTLESNLFEGEPMIHAYNTLDYDAAAVGNHEFDYGPIGPNAVTSAPGEDPLGALKRNAQIASFPLLSANMTEKATGRTPSWARAYTMVDADGAKIGIIGLSTPDTPNVTVPSNVRTLSFGDPVAATVAAAAELRAGGADAVVVIAHMGGRCTNVSDVRDPSSCDPQQEASQYLAALPPGTIDAYFGGHTHARMRHFVNGVAAVQGLALSTEFSTVDLYIDPQAGNVVRTEIRPLTMICPKVFSGTERCDPRSAKPDATLEPREFAGQTIVPDAGVQRVIDPYLRQVEAKKREPVGIRSTGVFTRDYSRESPLGDLLADALAEWTGADIGFMNSGGIRANLPAGDLVYADIFAVSPFDNFPAVVTMTGEQIVQALRATTTGERGILQVSGLRYTIDEARDAGKPPAERNRLVSVTLENGEPLVPEKLYTVAMPDFLVAGGDAMAEAMRDVPPERIKIFQGRPIRDVVIETLRKREQPIVPRLAGRITVLNERRSGD